MSTLLSYVKSAFTPFTKIVSADVNQYFTDLKNRLNWAGGTDTATGLGDDNIQSNAASGGGLTRGTKLKSGTANYCVINDSSGNMTEEQYLALSRGGMAGSMAAAVSGDVPVFSGSAFAPSGPNPAGTVLMYAGTSAPSGYLMCDGSAVSRTTYSRLFSAIGSNYGSGDGSTTFNVPDTRGLFPRGASGWASQAVTASQSGSDLLFTTTAGAITRNSQRVNFTATSSLPGNITAFSGPSTGVYFTYWVSSTTFKVCTNRADANGGTNFVAWSSAGSGVSVNNYEDTDLTSREVFTTGSQSSSTQPGTIQEDQIAGHTHTSYQQAKADAITSASGGGGGDFAPGTSTGFSSQISTATSSTGGNETRSRNLTFNYIIKT